MPKRYATLLPDQYQPMQRIFQNEWNNMVASVNERGIDILVLNGDLVDGIQAAARGRELWTTDLHEQIDAAEELIRQINFKKAFVTAGTPYHTDKNLNAEEVLADKLNAPFRWEFALNVEEARFHFSHEVGVSSSVWHYRTTPIARELVAALLQEKEFGHFDGIIRSHAHYCVAVEFGSHFGMITPCWQGRTPYMIRKGIMLTPKLGYIILNVNGSEVDREKHLFNIAQIEEFS